MFDIEEVPVRQDPFNPPIPERLQNNMAAIGEDEDLSMDEFLEREGFTYSSSIRYPNITARTFEVKPIMIQMIQMLG